VGAHLWLAPASCLSCRWLASWQLLPRLPRRPLQRRPSPPAVPAFARLATWSLHRQAIAEPPSSP